MQFVCLLLVIVMMTDSCSLARAHAWRLILLFWEWLSYKGEKAYATRSKGSMGKGFRLLDWSQEPITRILQLPHIPVTAFSQTDLFLVWIYVELSSPQEP